MNRRDFLRTTGTLTASTMGAFGATAGVAIVTNPEEPTTAAVPCRWALSQLKAELTLRNIPVKMVNRMADAAAGDLVLLIQRGSPVESKLGSPLAPEALLMAPLGIQGWSGTIVEGADSAGLTYALLELADRVRYDADPLAALRVTTPITERPANRIRSITRCFVSDVEDKPWFNDRAMWPEYLTLLATQRFNRFSLAFGIGYDFLKQIRDCYLHFAYPFLVDVPGYQVRAKGLPDAERDHNLEMLRFISEEAAGRGLHFQLGLWTHGYKWEDSPNANYVIEGLTPENHAVYCRDALHKVLEACPSISGVTLRIHGESGVAEGDYAFWKTLFDGILRTGRKIEIDMHAKGMDFEMIDVALATGLPVNVSPKYWAEHMGLPYHQAGIRELEMPPRDRKDEGFFARSNGSRKFLRYGYGDLLKEQRDYGVLHRMWPGTQRILLWGDPAMAAAYGRASSFCGSAGVELCEPLSFKGRKGSGQPGGRCGYADASLKPRWDWQKFEYTYRVWGRLLYNPESEPDAWERYLKREFGNAADSCEWALANASRILPLVTTAHGPSGANNSYWPEIYTNMPIVAGSSKQPYSDTPIPKIFGTVSPFDPELFSRIDDFASDLLAGKRTAQYSPIDVAIWLETFSSLAERHWSEAAAHMVLKARADFRRWDVDVNIQAGLGQFFAAKLRAGVLYAIHEQTGDHTALEHAVKSYHEAREAWAKAASKAAKAYVPDVSAGYNPELRGHWRDRLPAIDEDITAMAKRLPGADRKRPARAAGAIKFALSRQAMSPIAARHRPPDSFQPGVALPISIGVPPPVAVTLHYRHVDQGERFVTAPMELRDGSLSAVIPAAYTQSPFALQYYFEVRKSAMEVALFPGLKPPVWSQPYFLVRRA